MKLFKTLVALAIFGLFALMTVKAADTYFAAGTAIGVNTGAVVYAVVPHTGKSQSGLVTPAVPLLTYLNATTDTNGAVQFFNCGTPVACNFTNLGTTIYVQNTNTTGATTLFTNANGYNGTVIIYNRASGLYHLRTLGVATGNTNLVTTVATTNQIGDLIWPLANAGTIPVNATTKELNASAGGGGIFVGDPGEPLVFLIRGGTNCAINAWSARYP